MGFQSQGILPNDNRAEPLGAIISVAELYQIVKEYDKNFFENPMVVGRAKREAEIEQKKEYKKAVAVIFIRRFHKNC